MEFFKIVHNAAKTVRMQHWIAIADARVRAYACNIVT